MFALIVVGQDSSGHFCSLGIGDTETEVEEGSREFITELEHNDFFLFSVMAEAEEYVQAVTDAVDKAKFKCHESGIEPDDVTGLEALLPVSTAEPVLV